MSNGLPEAKGSARTQSSGSRQARARLRVVAPPRPRRFPFLIISFLLVGSLVVGVVSVQALVSQMSFRMQDLTTRNAGLEQTGAELKRQIGDLSAPQRIADEAKKLGYRFAEPDEVQTISVPGGAGTGGPSTGSASEGNAP